MRHNLYEERIVGSKGEVYVNLVKEGGVKLLEEDQSRGTKRPLDDKENKPGLP